MKKFKLKRLAPLMMAGVMAVTLGACAKNNSDNSSLGNKVVVETQNNEDFIFDMEATVAVPMEKVIMEKGEIGYKIPNNYYPYLIDEEKPMPSIYGISSENEKYKILIGCVVTNPDGKIENNDFSGCVAIYKPYYDILNLKETNEEEFKKTLTELQEKYGENSIQYKMFANVNNIKDIAKQVYYSNIANLKDKISVIDMEKFKINDWMPIAVDIEEIVMENGEIGYIIPNNYYPYLINSVQPIAQNSKILEKNLEYTIFGETKVPYNDGTVGYRGFGGCVAIYEPYFNILKLKELNNPMIFGKIKEDIRIFYGENSLEYKTFLEVDNIKEIATEVYYNTLNKSVSLIKGF